MSEKLRQQLTSIYQNLRLIREFMPSNLSKPYILLLLQLEAIEIHLKLDPHNLVHPIISKINDRYYRTVLEYLNSLIQKRDPQLVYTITKIKHELAVDLQIHQKGGCFNRTTQYVHEDAIKIKEKINELIDDQNQTIILFQKFMNM